MPSFRRSSAYFHLPAELRIVGMVLSSRLGRRPPQEVPMAGLIEDYAIIGNCEAAALVGRDGSMDWLGLPRFDSAACFAALLGAPENGRWQIAPSSPDAQVSRRYRQGSRRDGIDERRRYLPDLLQALDEEHDRVVNGDDRLDERAGRVQA